MLFSLPLAELPLHPAIVHLPLGLSMVMPLLTLALLVGRRWLGPPAVALVAGLQVLVLAGALAAERTGEEAEEGAERQNVPHDIIHEHEERAELFTLLAGITALSLIAAAAAKERKPALPLIGVGALLSAATLAQGLRTGHEGGELVFEHGAGVERVGDAAVGEPAGRSHEGAEGRGDVH